MPTRLKTRSPKKFQKHLPDRIYAPLKLASRHPNQILVDVEDELHDSALTESEAAYESDRTSESVSEDKASDTHDDDADAPRVAQWIDVDSESGSDVEKNDDTDHIPSAKPLRELRSLEHDLSSLPLGMLRKAQRTLTETRALGDSESESEDAFTGDDDKPSRSTAAKGKGKEGLQRVYKTRKDLAKRSNKHAPMEMSSKRPVSRRRVVIESKTPQSRDPRFLHITGDYKPDKFRQQYSFLSNLHADELKTLRENIKRARKLLANSPRDLREEREQEVSRLELAMKRCESAVNRDKREKIESEALQKATREEREKRQHGKAGWWMKSSEKKELLMKARYEEIASTGGKRAVKKAIEKKQKKISQKEKKSRPFAASQPRDNNGGSQKRPARFAVAEEGSGASKRRKFV